MNSHKLIEAAEALLVAIEAADKEQQRTEAEILKAVALVVPSEDKPKTVLQADKALRTFISNCNLEL